MDALRFRLGFGDLRALRAVELIVVQHRELLRFNMFFMNEKSFVHFEFVAAASLRRCILRIPFFVFQTVCVGVMKTCRIFARFATRATASLVGEIEPPMSTAT